MNDRINFEISSVSDMNQQPTLLSSWVEVIPPTDTIFLHNIIADRWSKYSVTCLFLSQDQKPKDLYREVIKHKYYKKATHNTYARRHKRDDGSIIEGKNDDGETWAGMCILRELKRVNFVNGIVIVTRYYWGTKLQNDRFKHVIDATKKVLKELT